MHASPTVVCYDETVHPALVWYLNDKTLHNPEVRNCAVLRISY